MADQGHSEDQKVSVSEEAYRAAVAQQLGSLNEQLVMTSAINMELAAKLQAVQKERDDLLAILTDMQARSTMAATDSGPERVVSNGDLTPVEGEGGTDTARTTNPRHPSLRQVSSPGGGGDLAAPAN